MTSYKIYKEYIKENKLYVLKSFLLYIITMTIAFSLSYFTYYSEHYRNLLRGNYYIEDDNSYILVLEMIMLLTSFILNNVIVYKNHKKMIPCIEKICVVDDYVEYKVQTFVIMYVFIVIIFPIIFKSIFYEFFFSKIFLKI